MTMKTEAAKAYETELRLRNLNTLTDTLPALLKEYPIKNFTLNEGAEVTISADQQKVAIPLALEEEHVIVARRGDEWRIRGYERTLAATVETLESLGMSAEIVDVKLNGGHVKATLQVDATTPGLVDKMASFEQKLRAEYTKNPVANAEVDAKDSMEHFLGFIHSDANGKARDAGYAAKLIVEAQAQLTQAARDLGVEHMVKAADPANRRGGADIAR